MITRLNCFRTSQLTKPSAPEIANFSTHTKNEEEKRKVWTQEKEDTTINVLTFSKIQSASVETVGYLFFSGIWDVNN